MSTLAIGDIIVGIDIGASKISLVVGEVNNFNQIEIICNKTEMVTINMYLGNHSSYDERYFNLCRYICDNMDIQLIKWDVVGWNERMVLLSDIRWKFATKEILENYLEEMAKVAHQIRDKLKDYGYDTSLWI